LGPDHRYFNAGVMIFDLEQIRRIDLEREVQSIYRRYGQLITLQDQDLLNIAFLGNYRELPLRWNANTRLFVPNELEPAYSSAEAEEAASDPGILHFTDRRKPWHDNSLNPLGEIYWDVRSRTPWPERQLDRLRRLVVRRLRHRFSQSQRDLDGLLAEIQRNSH
jgi:lipopolysaccharide biosynthesis glycosyltransferase